MTDYVFIVGIWAFTVAGAYLAGAWSEHQISKMFLANTLRKFGIAEICINCGCQEIDRSK